MLVTCLPLEYPSKNSFAYINIFSKSITQVSYPLLSTFRQLSSALSFPLSHSVFRIHFPLSAGFRFPPSAFPLPNSIICHLKSDLWLLSFPVRRIISTPLIFLRAPTGFFQSVARLPIFRPSKVRPEPGCIRLAPIFLW